MLLIRSICWKHRHFHIYSNPTISCFLLIESQELFVRLIKIGCGNGEDSVKNHLWLEIYYIV